MKVVNAQITNYRLLKSFNLDFENDLSLVIGKNNCGKTSLLSIMEKFLNSDSGTPDFAFEDFNIEFQEKIREIVEAKEVVEIPDAFGITLKLYIQYGENDNLSNISPLMLDLDPEITQIVLAFEYILTYEKLLSLRIDYASFKLDQNLSSLNNDSAITAVHSLPSSGEEVKAVVSEPKKEIIKKDVLYFLKKYHKNYFKLFKKSLEYNNESNFIDLGNQLIKLDKVINFKRIKAKRDVSNQDGNQSKSDKTLSRMSSRYYEKISNPINESESIKELIAQLGKTDEHLTGIYERVFSGVIGKVKKFGGIGKDESIINIISTLEEKNILKENTTVTYNHNSFSLPEDYNGLGYMNLIAMIFEIEVLLNDFKKIKDKEAIPADINILFIEEPEAHTHPQMQYIFIKNIKRLLFEASHGIDQDNIKFNLQTIITTHSSHITAESDFDDIKYFFKESKNSVIAKNLKKLKEEYNSEPSHYHFLTQYLTLNRTELFFADKAILIEGDTERLLLTAIMKKLDIEHKHEDFISLLSQNISVVEVGAHSHIFEKLIHFLGIKCLIITDFDTCKMEQVMKDGKAAQNKDGSPKLRAKKCRVAEGESSSNAAINSFYPNKSLPDLIALTISEKVHEKINNNWTVKEDGSLCIVFQTKENDYHARSYEDAFISLNLQFIKDNKDKFRSLKNVDELDNDELDVYDIADTCIDKKTSFALDVVFNSNEDYSNWQIPSYITEGLLWLRN
ncbi:ATP-dependent endonuclease [Pedobacter sp. Du54]|uniref:ATP-dependent endonuclease n=1 Tax=Pedobacter anseongensis TaxID=3133439 RepID=UPI0030B0C5EE